MKLPISWLREYTPVDMSAHQLADKLLSCGFEVEEIIYRGDNFKGIVAGLITAVTKHPDADKLKVCTVDTGDKELTIVTGADNIKSGDMVPVALHGSTVFGGQRIFKGKLRGVVSEGMLCSGEELGINEGDYPGAEVDGILILDSTVAKGSDMIKVLGLDEYVLDVSITANRPDCQSIIGLAREVAAVTGREFTPPSIDFIQGSGDISDYITVDVKEWELCPRYMAAAVKDIKIIPSPKIIAKRLRLCGLRPINAIVDITNYVLLEIGQPMHAFDLRRLSGGKIVVRRAQEGEKLITLNNQENLLSGDMLVICDDTVPEAVAGIMGGMGSGIKDDTQTVIFESAKFARDSVRKTSKKLNLRSDSSARFEKGVDLSSCEMGIFRALKLIQETGCGTVVGGIIDKKPAPLQKRTITAAVKDIDSLLGIKVPHSEILRILNSLNIKSRIDNGILQSEIPHYREDIAGYPDISEEIIRMYGYHKIVPTLLKKASVTDGGRTAAQRASDMVKQLLEQDGYMETVTFSFEAEDTADKLSISDKGRQGLVKISNPLSERGAVMRTTMLGSMLGAVSLNISRKTLSARLFEIGRTYAASNKPGMLPKESDVIAFIAYGEDEDFFTIKGTVESLCQSFGIEVSLQRSKRPYLHPGRGADVRLNGKLCGYFGEIHPHVAGQYSVKERIYAAELDFDTVIKAINFYKGYKNIPKYPEIHRDLALVADKPVSNDAIIDVMRKAGGEFLQDITLFDYYVGGNIPAGKKSLAYTLVLRDDSATLKSEQADEVVKSILKSLADIRVELRQ